MLRRRRRGRSRMLLLVRRFHWNRRLQMDRDDAAAVAVPRHFVSERCCMRRHRCSRWIATLDADGDDTNLVVRKNSLNLFAKLKGHNGNRFAHPLMFHEPL